MYKTSVQYLTIEDEYAGQRIDNYLLARLKNVPKTHIYRIVRKGEVRINKKRVQASYKLQPGDQLRLPPLTLEDKTAPRKPSHNLTQLLAQRILYEDNGLLIINKPSGIPVHGGTQVKLGIVEALRCMFPKLPHLELAHRLDADTSGCLILAKKRSVLRELHELMRSGQIRKLYHALTRGRWKKTEIRLEAALLKNQLSSGERIVRVNPEEGKMSVTRFRVLKTFPQATLVEALLETGRTHQIRVHAQHLGHPIAGDEKYGDREFNKLMRERGLRRLFLHAYSLEFVLPSTGEKIQVTAPLDEELQGSIL